jgi:hypothetical protein
MIRIDLSRRIGYLIISVFDIRRVNWEESMSWERDRKFAETESRRVGDGGQEEG